MRRMLGRCSGDARREIGACLLGEGRFEGSRGLDSDMVLVGQVGCGIASSGERRVRFLFRSCRLRLGLSRACLRLGHDLKSYPYPE